jgi:energy-coupling factor transport system ATP-binding protein
MIIADDTPKKVFLTQNLTNIGLKAPQTVEIASKIRNNNHNISFLIEDTIEIFKKNLSRIQYDKNEIITEKEKQNPVIEIENLSFKYKEKMILNDLNLIINKGDFIGLIGPNGSGKTTLAMLLVRLLKAKSGTIKIEGINVKKGIKKIRNKIGFLFQNPDVQLFCDSVKSELAYGLKSKNEALLEEVLSFMDLQKFKNNHPHTLSRGERQRVAIASILTLTPEILILDEPTSGQDWKHIEELMKLISSLHANGKTIILITHNMRIIAEYCNKIVILKDGLLYYEGDVRKAFSNIKLLKEADLRPPLISEISLKCGINPPLLYLEEFDLLK